MRLPMRAADPPRRFDADPAARTLKPADQLSWFDLDPKEATKWGGKYLRLSEDPRQPEGAGPQTPVYASGAPAKAAPPAPAPPKAEAALTDDEEYQDPIADTPPPPRKPAPKRKPKPVEPPAEDEGAVDTIFTEADKPSRPEPKPLPGTAKDAAPPPKDDKGARTIAQPQPDPNRKSVTDMSVDELQKYLSGDKK